MAVIAIVGALSAIVVAPPESASVSFGSDAGTPLGQSAPPSQRENRCSSGIWQAAPLGRYAAFIRRFAPQAFQPIKEDHTFRSDSDFVPDGLWGWKSGGEVRTCRIDTRELRPTTPTTSAMVVAKVRQHGIDSGQTAASNATRRSAKRPVPAVMAARQRTSHGGSSRECA